MDDGNFTQEQMEKAAVALKNSKANKFEKYVALLRRLNAKLLMNETKLPFKICHDIVKDVELGKTDEVVPNMYYPQPGPTWETRKYYRSPPGNAEMREKENADPEAQRQRAEYMRRIHAEQWKDDDWAYLFGRFLIGYDFDSFKNTDWTGEALETETAEMFKNFVKDIQRNVQAHPDWFYLSPNPREKWKKKCEFWGLNDWR